MCIQNNYNPLNLEFAFPKTSAKKFQTIELDLIDPLSKLFKGKAGIDEIPTK